MWFCSFSRIQSYEQNNVSYLKAGMHTLIQLVKKIKSNYLRLLMLTLCLLNVKFLVLLIVLSLYHNRLY